MSYRHNLKIGDIVTGYKSGLYVVKEIQQRYHPDINKYGPYSNVPIEGYTRIGDLVTLDQIYTGTLKKRKGTCMCDESFCHKLEDNVDTWIAELERQIEVYKQLAESIKTKQI